MTQEEIDVEKALSLQRRLPDEALRIVARGKKSVSSRN
jgi:hypothetical protein